MKTYLLPQLMCSAAAKGDIDTLLELKKQVRIYSLPEFMMKHPVDLQRAKDSQKIKKKINILRVIDEG